MLAFLPCHYYATNMTPVQAISSCDILLHGLISQTSFNTCTIMSLLVCKRTLPFGLIICFRPRQGREESICLEATAANEQFIS